MDISRLYRDYGVPMAPDGHKHNRTDWINVECPFCTTSMSNPGYHLGWNIEDEYFYCWRCGWKPPLKAISTLLHIPYSEAKKLLVSYGVNRTIRRVRGVSKKEFLLPSGLHKITPTSLHYAYLESRGFDPDKVIRQWKLKGTGLIGDLKESDYRFRIVIPFFWNGQMVSFDSRDITGKQEVKYKACPKEREIIEHKKILYGNQEKWDSIGICVEGPTDVWRLGPKAFATSGIEYTTAQLRIIATSFKQVCVIFDEESQAQKKAKKLVADLQFRGVLAWSVNLGQDPGSLSQREADSLVREIMKSDLV